MVIVSRGSSNVAVLQWTHILRTICFYRMMGIYNIYIYTHNYIHTHVYIIYIHMIYDLAEVIVDREALSDFVNVKWTCSLGLVEAELPGCVCHDQPAKKKRL